MKKVLLYSGGMDSWLIDKLWKPDIRLYVNMHTKYSAAEMQRLDKGVEIVSLNLGQWEREDLIIPLRNLYLVAVASNYGDVIALGATAGDKVLDKSLEFANRASDILTFLYCKQHWTEARNVAVVLPYKHYTKTQLLREYKDKGGHMWAAWRESFSCYNPNSNGVVCGICKPCVRKWVAFVNNDFFPKDLKPQTREYIVKNILPQIETGTFNRGKEDLEIQLAIEKTK